MNAVTTERSTDDAVAVTSAIEGEIRDYVRNDVVSPRRRRETGGELGADNVSSLVERVAGASIQEIDNLIAELQAVREFLQTEGERVQRELTNYAQATQNALASVRIIADNVGHWKNGGGNSYGG